MELDESIVLETRREGYEEEGVLGRLAIGRVDSFHQLL